MTVGSKKADPLPRPAKATDHVVIPATTHAVRGWKDLAATRRSALADAWDLLTADPTRTSPTMHTLRGDLQFVAHGGRTHEQWQLELPGGARIWYYVDDSTVYLVKAHTRHPNQTK